MYETTTFELRVFKLASFLEAFHNTYVFNESSSLIYAEKVNRKNYTYIETPDMELSPKNKKYLRNKKGKTSLSLKERFTELFDPFWKLITVQNPLLSFVTIDDPKSITLDLKTEMKNELVKVIKAKSEIDMNKTKDERESMYKELLQNINKNCELKLSFMYLIRRITIDNFAGIASRYRNIIGHSLTEHTQIHPYKWLYMAKILEFVSQIWILKKVFGLENKRIEEIYCLNEYDPIEVIIYSNIQEYNHVPLSDIEDE